MILEDAMASFTDNQDAGGGIETIQERRVRFITVEVYAYEYDGTGYPYFKQDASGKETGECETDLSKWPLGVPWRVLQLHSSHLKLDFRWHNPLLEEQRLQHIDAQPMQAHANSPMLTEQARWHVRAVFDWKDHPEYKRRRRQQGESAGKGLSGDAKKEAIKKALASFDANADKYKGCTGAVALWKKSPALLIGYDVKRNQLGMMRLRPCVEASLQTIDNKALRNTWAGGDPLQVGGDMWTVQDTTFGTRLRYSSFNGREYDYHDNSAGFKVQKQQLEALRDVQYLRVKVFQEAEEEYKKAYEGRTLPTLVGKRMIVSAIEARFDATDNGAKEVIWNRTLQWAQSRYEELSMYVCNVEPGRLFINTEDDTLESGKKLQTDALKHRLCTMRKMWLQEQQESTDPYKHPQASLQNPVPFSDRVTDDSSCKQGPEADIMKASYSGDALVYQLLWYVPEPENSNDPPAHTGKDAWNAWTQHMRVINPNTWIAEALTNGSNWRINYVSSDGKKIAGEPNAGMLDHIRCSVVAPGRKQPESDVRDKEGAVNGTRHRP